MTCNSYLELGNLMCDVTRLDFIYIFICTDFRGKDKGKILYNYLHDIPKDTLLAYSHWEVIIDTNPKANPPVI